MVYVHFIHYGVCSLNPGVATLCDTPVWAEEFMAVFTCVVPRLECNYGMCGDMASAFLPAPFSQPAMLVGFPQKTNSTFSLRKMLLVGAKAPCPQVPQSESQSCAPQVRTHSSHVTVMQDTAGEHWALLVFSVMCELTPQHGSCCSMSPFCATKVMSATLAHS